MRQRIFFLLTVVALLAVCLPSCGNQTAAAMTDRELTEYVNSDFLVVKELYEAFTGMPLAYDASRTIEVGGRTYAKVTDTRYASMASLEQALRRLFTEACVAEHFTPALTGDTPRYLDVDGVLYADMSLSGPEISPAIDEATVTVSSNADRVISFTVDTIDLIGAYLEYTPVDESGETTEPYVPLPVYTYSVTVTDEGDITGKIFKVSAIFVSQQSS